jgi:lipopolysaccharide/colanic/teichoic acid biosynthesis glycosyltransferase
MPIDRRTLMSAESTSGAVALDAREAYDFDDRAHVVPLVERPRLRLVGPERARTISRVLHATAKRTLDVLVASTVLLAAMPLVAIVAAAIVIESPGPVFFRAERVGRNGRRLRMLKFRKMHHGVTGAPLTLSEDARLTRVGRLLAKLKLDELPQLWHVVKGDMSLIGPRPEDPGFVAERADDYEEILRVRPGVTGLSQLAFATESAILCKSDPVAHYRGRIFPQKIALDRMYASCPTVWMDVRILFWTVAAVMLRRDIAVHRETGQMNLRRR